VEPTGFAGGSPPEPLYRGEIPELLTDRKRIMVVGSGGAGKTTLALKLGELTRLPVVHLDRHNWHSGWVPTPADEWRPKVEALAASDEWIIDGNYGGTLGIRVRRCDAIVFFDFNRVTCLWGAAKRAFLQRGASRPDMPEGCPERLDWAFLRWIWGYSRVSRPKVLSAIERASDDVEVVMVRNRRQARNLLESMRAVPV